MLSDGYGLCPFLLSFSFPFLPTWLLIQDIFVFSSFHPLPCFFYLWIMASPGSDADDVTILVFVLTFCLAGLFCPIFFFCFLPFPFSLLFFEHVLYCYYY